MTSLTIGQPLLFFIFLYFIPVLCFCNEHWCVLSNVERSSPLFDREDATMFQEEDDDDNDDFDDDDDDIPIKPYRNRSLVWTKRYRKLNPFEKCRKRVLQFGHRSKEDWDEAVASGQLGQYVPSHPDEMYAPEWVSWDEWLGLMRSYEETRQLAISVLQCKSLDDYILFVRSNPKRAEGLRIPVRPDLFYKEEWKSEQDFFGAPLDGSGI